LVPLEEHVKPSELWPFAGGTRGGGGNGIIGPMDRTSGDGDDRPGERPPTRSAFTVTA
jgi:hypothetical protein